MFYILFSLLLVQRAAELFVARKNEKWMKDRGGIEYGNSHYRYIVILHILFLISLFSEAIFTQKGISQFWYIIVPIFIFTQIIRYWAVTSLGPYWNTKIIIVPDDVVVSKGPYQYIRHPNYVVVALEIIFIPLLFQAYFTSVCFTLLNILMMAIRIPAEEKALQQKTNYGDQFYLVSRFLPRK